MKYFQSAIKLIVGCFLFGVVFLATPKSVSARGESYLSLLDNETINLPYTHSYNDGSTFVFNLADNAPVTQYGLVPYSSFDVDLNISYLLYLYSNSDFFVRCGGSTCFEFYLLFSSSDNVAYQKYLGSACLSRDTDYLTGIYAPYDINYNFTFHSDCEGIPTGIRVTYRSTSNNLLNITGYKQELDYNSGIYSYDQVEGGSIRASFYAYFHSVFYNFSFDEGTSSGGSSNTIINNTTDNLTPIGYSSLNFGLNGNTYFLGASRVFEPSYLSPLMFSYDFANTLSGVISSAPLTLAMGGFDSGSNTAHASPISVIGDTRAGEYELTISLCLTNSPSASQLSALTNLSNWGFEFNRGYSGQQFSMPSNCRISYTNFIDSKTSYCYTSIYFYFTTPDYFDSFLIRTAPTLNNIRVGAFAFNKYTGTISDEITVINEQWDSAIPNHSSFSSANSGASSAVSAMSGIESSSFGALNSAMTSASIDSFSLSTMSTPISTVSGLINQTYNILPSSIKWLITAILVIGILACIVSASRYTNTD